MATPEQWYWLETWHKDGRDPHATCIIELRERMAGLEAQQQPAPPEPTQRTEPEVARKELPAAFIDPEHSGPDREMLETFYAACRSEGGTADEIYLRGLRAVLRYEARRAALGQQAQQPAPAELTQRTEPEVQKAELWEQMADAWQHTPGIVAHVAAAEIDVVADWLARYGHDVAALALRHEARRARGEA